MRIFGDPDLLKARDCDTMLIGSAKKPSGTYLRNQPGGLLMQKGPVEVHVMC